MVDEPIDRGGGRHLIAKNPLPLPEHEIARQDHRAALVAFGQEREEHLGFLWTLLDVAQIIEQ